MNKPSQKAMEIAAQCWTDEETSMIEMDTRLAMAFARRLDMVMDTSLRNTMPPSNETQLTKRQQQMLEAMLLGVVGDKKLTEGQLDNARKWLTRIWNDGYNLGVGACEIIAFKFLDDSGVDPEVVRELLNQFKATAEKQLGIGGSNGESKEPSTEGLVKDTLKTKQQSPFEDTD